MFILIPPVLILAIGLAAVTELLEDIDSLSIISKRFKLVRLVGVFLYLFLAHLGFSTSDEEYYFFHIGFFILSSLMAYALYMVLRLVFMDFFSENETGRRFVRRLIFKEKEIEVNKHYSRNYAQFMVRLIDLARARGVINSWFSMYGGNPKIRARQNRQGITEHFVHRLTDFINNHFASWNDKEYKIAIVEEVMAETENITFMAYLLSVLEDEKLSDFMVNREAAGKERHHIEYEISRIISAINNRINNYVKLKTLTEEEESLQKLRQLKRNDFTRLVDIRKGE